MRKISIGAVRDSTQRILSRGMEFWKSHRRELIFAIAFAALCAVAIEVYKAVSEEHKTTEDRQTRHQIADATAQIVAYDENNRPTNLGVGIFVSSDGKLITGYLPDIEKFSRVEAQLASGAIYKKGSSRLDKDNDLTVLQFIGRDIPFVPLGDSDRISFGQNVVALLARAKQDTAISGGNVTNPNRMMGTKRFIQFITTGSIGGSYGELFSEGGSIVGYISTSLVPATFQRDLAAKYAVPINPLKPIIEGRGKSTQESPDYWYSRGVLAENKRSFAEALNDFNKAVHLDKTYAHAYLEMGGIYYDQGDFDKQLDMYKLAALYAPEDFDIQYYLATAYEDKSLYDDAIATYQRTLRIKPDHKDSLYQLTILYLTRGEKEKALATLSNLERLDPGLAGELKLILNRMK